MSESNSSSITHFTVFDYLGLGCILGPPGVAVDALMKGEKITWSYAVYGVPAVIIGAICIYVGRNWPTLKTRVWSKLADGIDRSNNGYFAAVVAFTAFLLLVAVSPMLIWPPSALPTTLSAEDIASAVARKFPYLAAAQSVGSNQPIITIAEANRGLSKEEKERLRTALFDASQLIDEGNKLFSKISGDINSTITKNDANADYAGMVAALRADNALLLKFRDELDSWRSKWAFFDKQVNYVFGERPLDAFSGAATATTEYIAYFDAWRQNTTKQLTGAFMIRNMYESAAVEPPMHTFVRWLSDSGDRLKEVADASK